MTNPDFTHALVSLADQDAARAIAAALHSKGWTADVQVPQAALAALDSGRHGVAVVEYLQHRLPWKEVARIATQQRRRPCLLAICSPDDAFFALCEDVPPCAYALKPVDAKAVAQRADALARGRGDAVDLQVEDGMVLDRHSRRVFCPGGMSQLRRREFDLLRLLVARKGQVVTRDETIRYLYRWGEDIGSNTIDVHISALRRQLANLPIRTVRGEGYVLGEAAVNEDAAGPEAG